MIQETNDKTIKENLDWVDSLRVLATFSVIVLHVAAGVYYQYGSISNFDWWTANIYSSIVRFCVPIFLMISGALMFSKTYEKTGEFLKRRLMRIVLPFLFWSLVYISVSLFFKFHDGTLMSAREILKFIFMGLRNGASYHLWYMYMVVGLYLFFPIIGKWLQNSDENGIKYFLLIWILTVVSHLMFVEKLFPNIETSYFSGFIGFPVLGYYLNKTIFNFRNKKAVYLILITVGILTTMFGTSFMTYHNNQLFEGFYSYLSLNVIIVSIGVFLLFKDFIRFNSKAILFFSKYSFGIYLVHVMILTVVSRLGISFEFGTPIIGIPVLSVFCFISSTVIIWGVNKLPFGKFISG